MNTLCKIFFVWSLFSFTYRAFANDTNEKATQTTRLEQYTPIPTNTPRTPSYNFINCNYSIGYIEFEIPYNIESIDVTIYNSNTLVWSGTINNEEYYAQIPVLYGCYEIVCITSEGDEYLGILHFAH